MLVKDELIPRIKELDPNLSGPFLRQFSEATLSAYLCYLETVAKFKQAGPTEVVEITVPDEALPAEMKALLEAGQIATATPG